MFSDGVLKFLFFDGKGIVLSLVLLAWSTLSFWRLRREHWTGTFQRIVHLVIIVVSFFIVAFLIWFIFWIVTLDSQFDDVAHITPNYRDWIDRSLIFGALLGSLATAIDRQIVLYSVVRDLSDLRIESSKLVHGDKSKIDSLISQHTKAAKKSVIMFSGRMTYIDRERTQLGSLRGIKFRNLALSPSDAADAAYITIGKDLGIETRYYITADPLIRGRIIDPEIPRISKIILISKEQDHQGKVSYSARVYTRQESELFMDITIHLFEALWANASAGP